MLMDGWWDEIESEIAGWMERRGETSVAELAQHLALSEEATASLIAVLMVGRPVQITRVGDTCAKPPSTNSSAPVM
jgi:hypothetical protein